MTEKSPGEKLLAQAHLDEESLQIPAPVVNKFRLLFSDGNLRIAFAEGFADRPNHYRSAVIMSANNALELAVTIIGLLPSQLTLSAPLNSNTARYADKLFALANIGRGAAGTAPSESTFLGGAGKNG
jgi:hypothetical protein